MNKNNEYKLVPKLRFSNYSESWTVLPVSEICEVFKGSPLSKIDLEENGTEPCIHYGELFTKYNEVILATYSKTNRKNGFRSVVGDILMPSSDVTPTGLAKASAIMLDNVILGGDMNILRPQTDINSIFFSYLLNRSKREIIKLVSGTTVKHIYPSQIITCRLPIIKNFDEQLKIASCLSSLDEVITAESQKLELYQQHKKGLLQNLFPQEGEKVPKLRFPEFEDSGEWELKKLGEVGTFFSGGTPDTQNKDYWNGDILWFTPTEVKEKYLKGSNRKITESGLRNSAAKLLPKGSILITTRATIGDIGITLEECTTNQGFQSLVVNKDNSIEFWYYYIYNNKSELDKRASGSTFKEITKSKIITIPIVVPSLSEQQKIAACLSSLDDLINAQRQKIELLKQHKKGLLQGLFPPINN
jgi:type I restriction enzyme S subunit